MEKKFVKGIYIEVFKFDNGGSILKCSVGKKFIEFYEENKNDYGYLKFDIKKSKDKTDENGNPIYYATLNEYKKDENIPENSEDDDLPF